MQKKLFGLFVMMMLLCSVTAATAQVSIGIGLPNVSIGINLPLYPELVPVPGYPVYYAPQVNANYFFYDGMYWVFVDDNWYASSWYNGPWALVEPIAVPVYILRIPVGYYRHPPAYFHGWQRNAPPHWGQHWGHEWAQSRRGWNSRNIGHAPAAAPLPSYQREYARDRYPSRVEQQHMLRSEQYHYQPHETVIRQHYQQQQQRYQQQQHPQQQQQRYQQQQQHPQQQQQRYQQQQQQQQHYQQQQQHPQQQEQQRGPEHDHR